MGDHRATITIEFTVHQKTYKQEWWINYCPDDQTGIDQRIADWFAECWRDAYARYRERIAKIHARECSERQEIVERLQLSYLKKKYPDL